MVRNGVNFQIINLCCIELLCTLLMYIQGAVIPPPWANPKINPCAAQPRGWQLLYWPPDGKCYKIFQKGYPCPDEMELSPAASTASAQTFSAECRCPPRTAQSARDGRCYELFTAGPCEEGHYFAPDTEYLATAPSKRRWGTCKQLKQCPNINEIFWPSNGQCYQRLTKGPCPKGQLLTTGPDKLAVCKCDVDEMEEFHHNKNGCFQHFTKGPCKQKGHLFLPDRQCGCHDFLPHYHEETKQCFEIGAIGPCNTGENFQLDPDTGRGRCVCKTGYIRFTDNKKCYRPYTQGPCNQGEILVNQTTCITLPCERGQLYFPHEKKCYRIGTKGPCPQNQLVTFDFETRPSVDGLSYNGLCSCKKSSSDSSSTCQATATIAASECEKNALLYENRCYRLYTQGPCAKGAWIVPKREGRGGELWTESKKKQGICDCMPGYTKSVRVFGGRNVTECVSPTVLIADYLNRNYYEQMQSLNSDARDRER